MKMIVYQKEGLTVFQSALWKTTSIVFEADSYVLIVDPTWLPHEVEEIKRHVTQIRNGRQLYMLFTHGDFDHIIGYRALNETKVIGSKGLQHHPNKEYKLNLIQQFDKEYYIERSYPIEFPDVDIVITEDRQQLIIGETTITFYLSPGHTHDGLFTVIEPRGILITGDYLSDFELPFIFDSAKAYENTLEMADEILNSHAISVLIPGHGQVTEDNDEINSRVQSSKSYLKRLIHAVQSKDEQTLKDLRDMMPYPSSFTTECHDKNVSIIREEYMEKGLMK